jgi:P27 family predicted phage terminase small subunit
MGKRGPNRTPTAVLEARGSWRGSKRKDKGANCKALGTAQRPQWIKGAAKDEWERLSPKLRDLGILTPLDRAMFSVYCELWKEFLEAKKIIDKDGPILTTDRGHQVKHPAVRMMHDAADRLLKIAREFGLTPSSRASMDFDIQSIQDNQETWLKGKARFFDKA